MAEQVSHEQSYCEQREHECVICTMSSTKFITFESNNLCCKECFSKIDKCHMCRAPIKRIKPMKVILAFPGDIITHSTLMRVTISLMNDW
jgi:hypothetical protein